MNAESGAELSREELVALVAALRAHMRGDELRALCRLQRESETSPFVFVSERGSPCPAVDSPTPRICSSRLAHSPRRRAPDHGSRPGLAQLYLTKLRHDASASISFGLPGQHRLSGTGGPDARATVIAPRFAAQGAQAVQPVSTWRRRPSAWASARRWQWST
jgi:hypothetical protein